MVKSKNNQDFSTTKNDYKEENIYEEARLIQKELIDDDQQIEEQITEKLKEFFKVNFEENKDHETKTLIKEFSYELPKEYDTEDEIARDILKDVKEMINAELKSKEVSRKKLTNLLIISFIVLGIFVIGLTVFSMFYDTKIVLAVISGFFINAISLILVLLRYMFSPSKELYTYTIDILKRKNSE